jgi:hypothetical protein
MIRRFLCCTAAVVAGTALVASAAPKDEVTDAAKKLSDAKNYSWKQTMERAGGGGGGGGNFRAGPTEGKTEKGGPTLISMSFGDNTIEAVRQGEKGAVKTQDGWQSFEELRQNAQGGQGGPGRGFFGMRLRSMKNPAEEAQDLVAKSKEIKKSGDAYEAELTEEGAKDLASFRPGGRGGNAGNGNFQPPEVSNAKGTAKFWVKDGQLAKYEYHVQGNMSFNGQDREINRTTTVEIKDVGSTKVEIPAEAKAKMS